MLSDGNPSSSGQKNRHGSTGGRSAAGAFVTRHAQSALFGFPRGE
jgi:hypothetical protein